MNQAASLASSNASLYSLGESWGEGTSLPAGAGGQGVAATPGDATWLARFYDAASPTLWSTAGGSYSATASATSSVGSTSGYYTWSSSQVTADVKGWLATPATNFGWALIGDETTAATAHVFDSREGAANVRPQLQISYNPVLPPLTRRESWLRQYFPTPGTYVDDLADLDGDGLSNVFEYAFAFSPLAANPAGSGVQISATPSGTNTLFAITFRRDPRAVDLTYILQASSDLVTWDTIVQSSGGLAPTGTRFDSETDAPGEAPIKIVKAVETVTAPAKRFGRLKIIRAH